VWRSQGFPTVCNGRAEIPPGSARSTVTARSNNFRRPSRARTTIAGMPNPMLFVGRVKRPAATARCGLSCPSFDAWPIGSLSFLLRSQASYSSLHDPVSSCGTRSGPSPGVTPYPCLPGPSRLSFPSCRRPSLMPRSFLANPRLRLPAETPNSILHRPATNRWVGPAAAPQSSF
jgi:hypothetical protein